MLLTIPVEGYLEGPEGPVALRDVEWIEFSTKQIKGGLAGRPMQFVDIEQDLLSAMRDVQVVWEVRQGSWSVNGLFDNEPVRVVRIVNPFGPETGVAQA